MSEQGPERCDRHGPGAQETVFHGNRHGNVPGVATAEREQREAQHARLRRFDLTAFDQPVQDFAQAGNAGAELALGPQEGIQPGAALGVQVQRTPDDIGAVHDGFAARVTPDR